MDQLTPSDQHGRPERVGPYTFVATPEGVDVYATPRLPDDDPIMSIPIGQVAETMAALGRAGVSSFVMATTPRPRGRAA